MERKISEMEEELKVNLNIFILLKVLQKYFMQKIQRKTNTNFTFIIFKHILDIKIKPKIISASFSYF